MYLINNIVKSTLFKEKYYYYSRKIIKILIFILLYSKITITQTHEKDDIMNNVFSNNVNNVEISGIRKFFNKVSKVQGAISLTLGQPDFPVPKNIKKAMISAIT